MSRLKLSHSRMMFVSAHPRETQEMVFDAHERKAFAFFKGGVRTRGIYDNMKTAVETIFVKCKERGYNRRFLQMCSHHLVDPVACTPASGLGERPGGEPGSVNLVRERFFTARGCGSRATTSLNAWLGWTGASPTHKAHPASRALRANRSGRSSRRSGPSLIQLSRSLRRVPGA